MPTDDQQNQWEPRIFSALNDPAALQQVLEEIHAADLADVFIDLDEPEQICIMEALTDEQAAALLSELEPDDQSHTLDLITVERTSDILEEMPSDDAADLLAELPTHEADALLERMEPEMAEDVTALLRYPEETAGGLMAREFVGVAPEQTVADVLVLLRRHHDDAEMIYYLYVLDEEGRLLGVVSLRSLIISAPEVEIAEIMHRDVISVPVQMPQEDVAALVRRHDLLAVPVLDDDGRMQGIITVDDVADVVQDEAAEDLLEIGGSEDGAAEEPSGRGWRSGLLATAGGVLIAAIIWAFSFTHEDWLHVAALLPLLLLIGLTAGSQAVLAIDQAVLREAEQHQLGRIVIREILAGAVLALIGGALAGVLSFAIFHESQRALATAIPMALGIWAAPVVCAIGAAVGVRHHERLRPVIHTLLVVLGLLLAVVIYLVIARWTSAGVLHHIA